MILVYGTVCVDRVRRVTHLPKLGGYVSVLSEELRLGGEAANTAFALKTWGADFKLIGNHSSRRNDSVEWDQLWRLLDEAELSSFCPDVSQPGSSTVPICDIYITPGGQRTMFGLGFDHLAEGMAFDRADLDGVDWFTIDMNFGKLGQQTVKDVSQTETQIYLLDFVNEDDPIPANSVWQSSTDWVGKTGDMATNMKVVASVSHAHDVRSIVTDGENGTVSSKPGEPVSFVAPYPSSPIVDSTGAGDTFRAAMLFQMSTGANFERSIEWASVAASLKCRFPGAAKTQPSREEIDGCLANFDRNRAKIGSE
ncbi:MAG: carbohydrate kinase family protein [Fimbriimonadaceae bacterium]